MIAISSNFLRLVSWPNTWWVLENELVHLRRMCTLLLLGGVFSMCLLILTGLTGLMLFRPFTSLMICYQVVLSIIESGVLKFATILVDLSILSFNSRNIYCVYLEVLMVDAYIFIIVTSFRWTDPIIIIYYHSCLFFKKDFYLLTFRERGMEGERVGNIGVQGKHPLAAPRRPPTKDLAVTQVRALIGNWTGDPLICGAMPNPLSHTHQGHSCLL